MEIQQTPLRTAIMRIMSDLLDGPDKNGIYETTRFMDRIEQLVCDMMAAPEVMQLSGSEAVMGFLAWLSTRDETTVLGPNDVVDLTLYKRFVEANSLTEPRAAYHELLTHPKEPEPALSQQPFLSVAPEPTILEELEAAGFQPMYLDGGGDAFKFDLRGGLPADDESDFEVGMPDFSSDPESIHKEPYAALFGPDGKFIVSGSIDEIASVLADRLAFSEKL